MIGPIQPVQRIGFLGAGVEERTPPPDPVDLLSPSGAPLLSTDGAQLQFQPTK